ncbi:hypothetical protein, partial [Gloeocapsopsis dulcis]
TDDTPIEQPIDNTPPTDDTPIEQPIDNTPIEQPVDNTPPTDDTLIEQPVDNTPSPIEELTPMELQQELELQSSIFLDRWQSFLPR